jgi:hypothetical protein
MLKTLGTDIKFNQVLDVRAAHRIFFEKLLETQNEGYSCIYSF